MGDIMKNERLKLSGTMNSPEEAENIFKEIEVKTGTKIQFESGHFTSTYKRDPIIRLCGAPDAVKIAREMVLNNLEMQSDRIVLKMDITHEEHPSLIGKKGCLIKKVMQSTNTHIHFPDTNKIPANSKTNQVSIAGEPLNVERARIMLRALLPFQVIFEVDMSIGQAINTTSPIWKNIQEQFHLEIHFLRQKTVMSIIIRCCQGLFPSLRQYVLTLIEILSGKRGSDLPPVSVVMDIMPQHHNFVKGLKGNNIQAIAKRTGAKILFPNLNSEPSETRRVNITGTLDCVYMGWQEVMSSLPVFVSFDVNENRDLNNDYMDFLLDCNMSVYCRPKPKYCIKSITVKGPEKFSKQIVQYRQRVLNLPAVKFQSDMDDVNKALTFQNSFSEIQDSQVLKHLLSVQLEDLNCITNISNYIESNIMPAQVPYTASLYPSQMIALDKYEFENSPGNNVLSGIKPTACETRGYFISPSNTGNSTYPVFGSKPWAAITAIANNNNNSETPIKESKQLHEHEIFEKKLSAYQAIHRRIESTQVPSSLWAGYGFSQSMPAAACASKDKKTSSRYSCRSLESNSSSSSDESWGNIVLANYIDDKIWSDDGDNSVFSMSNVFDFKRNTSLATNFDSENVLPKLLYEVGLYNYIDVFLREEIDYEAFLLLNESDLSKMGINYQARMKITCLIRELQDAEMKAKTFDVAPGAERKMGDNYNIQISAN